MSAMDLWGDFVAEPIRTPVAVLREQATLLSPKTEGLISAEVTTEVYDGEFIHAFELVVPTLQFYRYRLFEVRHSSTLYPVRVIAERTGPRLTDPFVDDEEAFTDWLRGILSSDKTKKIISSLLAQAKS